jgi:hypothetical protein
VKTDPLKAQFEKGKNQPINIEQTEASQWSQKETQVFTVTPPATLPPIELPEDGQYLSQFGTELGKILSVQDVFRRFDKCIAPKADEQGRIILSELNPKDFQSLIEYYCSPFRLRKNGERFKRSINLVDASTILVARCFLEPLRPVRFFNQVRLPALYEHQEIRLLPLGYDAIHQIYTVHNALAYPFDTTLEDAIAFFETLLCEFCFVEAERDISKSVVIASALTLFAKHLLPRQCIRPNFLVSANSEGSGKTLLCKIPIIALLGYAPAGTVTEDEDEMRKLIGAAALSGSPILFLDNVKGLLNSPSLEALTTSPVTQFRLLGKNKLIEAEHGLTVFVTSNNASFSPDLRRRTLTVELFLSEVQSESRAIQHPLDDERLIQLQPQILGALWALVRHWAAKDFPKPKKINQSFGAWSQLIGGILECAGYVSPIPASASTAMAGDRELIEMVKLVEHLVEEKAYSFSELVELARHHRCFEWLLGETGDDALDRKERVTFSNVLRRFTERLFPSGCRFVVFGASARKRYGVTRVTFVKPL